jgi:hypothetical protein
MLLVDDILLFPVHSIMWVFREITEQLRVLYMQLETGRITEAEFDAREKLLLDRLDAIESRREDEDETEVPDEDNSEESGVVGRVVGETEGSGRPV